MLIQSPCHNKGNDQNHSWNNYPKDGISYSGGLKEVKCHAHLLSPGGCVLPDFRFL